MHERSGDMNKTARSKSTRQEKDRKSLFGSKSKKKDDTEYVTVKEEKKTLVRIVKAKPKAIKHRADVLDKKTVTEDEMRITKSVVEKISSSPERQVQRGPRSTQRVVPKTFACAQCGAPVPLDADACPRCRVRYIRDIPDEALAELDLAEQLDEEELMEIKDINDLPVLHFDAMDGLMHYLEHDEGESEFVLECNNCGTLVQLDIGRCPLCGAPLGVTDAGLVSIIAGTGFNEERMSELECPSCGEHVVLVEGACPLCDAVIEGPEGSEADDKTIPLIQTENVVFVHLDLETGDLNYLQRHLNKMSVEHMSIHLDGIGNDGFDKNWEGLSRI